MSIKLRKAAQAVVKAYEDGEYIHKHFFRDLRDALAEDRLDEMQSLTESEYREPEYELWGRVAGGHGSRWPVEQFDGRIWPVGTALYVQITRGKDE
jgi:hypothetical protein